jgi:hypothetical protein
VAKLQQELNELRTRERVSSGIRVRAYKSAAQLLTHNTPAAIQFDTERYDTDGMHDAGTPTRFTIQTAGLYHIGATIAFAANATGQRNVGIRVDGTTDIVFEQVQATGALRTIVNIGIDHVFAAGQYFEVWALQTSGGNLNVETVADYSPEVWAHFCP